MNNVDISVLLCTYNRAEILKTALQSILDQELGAESFTFEVVVVDNGSTDNTKQVMQELMAKSATPIRYFHEPAPGIAQARNRSVREGRGEWFAFLDDDEIADPGWLRNLMAATRQSNAKIFGGSVRLLISPVELANLGLENRRSLRERDPERWGDEAGPCRGGVFPGTDNMLVSREIFDSVGGFDETMKMGGSDYDLMVRARKAGYQAWFVPEAVVHHRVPEERLSHQYIKRDSFRQGLVLAYLTQRYHGSARMIGEMIARMGQAALVTLPMLAVAWISRDSAEILDRKIKWWRLLGYMRTTLDSFFFRRDLDQSFVDRLSFRKTRPKIHLSDDDQQT